MCTKCQFDIFKKWLSYDINMSKTGTFHVISGLKGSMPPCIDHMELLAWMQRADFSEHIQRFKRHGNPLNSPHVDAPNTKLAPTGYRRAPNMISHHHKQQLSAKASINTESSTNRVPIKRLINTISSPEQSQMSHARQIQYHSRY